MKEYLQAAVRAFELEHKRLEDTWRTLETKAQGVIAVSGVFIGLAIAYSREVQRGVPAYNVLIVLAVILLLGAAILFAAAALRVQPVRDAPTGDNVASIAEDLAGLPESEIEGKEPLFFWEMIQLWRGSNAALANVCERKATMLQIAQILLVVAVALAGVLAIATTLQRHAHSPTQTGRQSDAVYQIWVHDVGAFQQSVLPEAPTGTPEAQEGRTRSR